MGLSCVAQISSYFTGKILGVVRDTIYHMKGMSRSDHDEHNSRVGVQPAGNTQNADGALEFIKHVCAVFALDQTVQHEILVILAYWCNYLET